MVGTSETSARPGDLNTVATTCVRVGTRPSRRAVSREMDVVGAPVSIHSVSLRDLSPARSPAWRA